VERWLAVPPAITLGGLVEFTRIPADVRLAVSRPAMDRAAREVMAGGDTDRSWIGLYPVRFVEGTADSMHFLIDGAGLLDGMGFAYFKDGKQPADSPPVEYYEPIGVGWWSWSLYFD
jgi:hypothetical protein